MDMGWFQESGPWTNRKYELDVFNVVGSVASKSDIQSLRSMRQNPFSRRLPSLLKNLLLHTRQSHIIEKNYNFNPEILALHDNVYLDGYWQSEKYFSDIEPAIRREFSFRIQPTPENRQWFERIHSCESTSIHIRRGDYVTLPEANAFHGLCSPEYYQSAVQQIRRQIKNPVFFVFSDDIAWAMDNLRFDVEINFVDINSPEKGYEDMRLMSACNHHIIANSSFSWWGAWLGDYPDKIVCTPKRWFNAQIDTSDNIPSSWLKI